MLISSSALKVPTISHSKASMHHQFTHPCDQFTHSHKLLPSSSKIFVFYYGMCIIPYYRKLRIQYEVNAKTGLSKTFNMDFV